MKTLTICLLLCVTVMYHNVVSATEKISSHALHISPVTIIGIPEKENFRFRSPYTFPAYVNLQTLSVPVHITFIQSGETGFWGDVGLNWPADASNAVVYAAQMWSAWLNSTETITLEATWTGSLPPGVLGHSGPVNYYRDFSGAPVAGTFYPVTLANSLYGGDLDPAQEDFAMAFSSSFSWYTGTDGNPSGSQYDLVTVILHEMCHGLGFLGSMDVSVGFGNWGWGYGYPVIYDQFTETGGGTSLLNTVAFPNPSLALGNALRSGDLFFNGLHANAANGGPRVPIYAPSVWNDGSSYSHLDEVYNGTINDLMTYSIGYGTAIHTPGPVTEGLLTDIGWDVIPEPSLFYIIFFVLYLFFRWNRKM